MLKPQTRQEEWEWLWAPYDAPTYHLVLEQIKPNDIVLEIGAGDLRLSRQIAARARWVYAIEINESLLEAARGALPANLQLIIGDARVMPFADGTSSAVLLMRHCTHFSLYFDKLQAAGCRRLITNARWGMGVETINLNGPRCSYDAVTFGWYACCCGSRGFKPGPAEALTKANADRAWELSSCPFCSQTTQINRSGSSASFSFTGGSSW
jgi:SAM-dependent methyltransferase